MNHLNDMLLKHQLDILQFCDDDPTGLLKIVSTLEFSDDEENKLL
jgi:hypothetical protein